MKVLDKSQTRDFGSRLNGKMRIFSRYATVCEQRSAELKNGKDDKSK